MLKNFLKYFYFLTSICLYGYISFYLKRTDFFILVSLFTILFFCYYKLIIEFKNDIKFLILATFSFRIIFGWVLPNLSQDFYRFIWDGRLIIEGINPYLHLPKDLILVSNFQINQAQELFVGMGNLSAKHYSNYPPINQLCFSIAGLISSNSIFGSVAVLRFLIILADLGTLYFGRKLLNNLALDQSKIFWYLLNPLVILELSGNLHFEGVMLFFFILSMYLIQKKRFKFSAIVLAVSISIKLLPLLLLPIFYKYLGFKKAIIYYSITIATCVLFFLPFSSIKLIENYTETIALWFTNFEFNASFYYIIRYFGYQIYDYNIIHTVGKIVPVVIILFILYRSFFTKNVIEINLFNNFLIILAIYFFTSTTVHPWYIINLILLSVFTKYKFAFVWSFLIILSYFTYSSINFKENYYLIFLQYSIVYVFFIFETRKHLNFSKKELSATNDFMSLKNTNC